MHSSCLISSMSPNAGKNYAGSNFDRHPAQRTRKQNLACDRRLEMQLAFLDQQRKEVSDRINENMTAMKKKLEEEESAQLSREKLHTPSTGLPLTSKDRSAHSNLGDSLFINNDNNKTDFLKLDPVISQTTASRSSSRCRNTASRRKRRRLIPKACEYGGFPRQIHCQHFPCRQPQTYHSLGFRTSKAISQENANWFDPSKPNLLKPSAQVSSEKALPVGLSPRHLLSASHFVGPLDSESKIKLLRLEFDRRKRENEASRPNTWVTNYGTPTPYKFLRKPARLRPLEMTTFLG